MSGEIPIPPSALPKNRLRRARRFMVSILQSSFDSIKFVVRLLWAWPVVGIGSPLLYAYGVNAMYGNDFIAAEICYFVAMIWIISKILTWEKISDHNLRRGISLVILILATFLFGLSLLAVKHRKSLLFATDFPHLKVLLMIDSITEQTVGYHFRLENIGHTLVVKDIRFSMTNEQVTDEECMVPPGRTLPANGGQIEIPGLPEVFLPTTLSNVVVAIHYGIEGSSDKFSATYRFLVNPIRVVSVAPVAFFEREGMTGEPKIGMADWLAKWESPRGTMLLKAVYESRQDGTPNVATLMDLRRYLRFDPVSRTVVYVLRLNSGRVLKFELPLKSVLPHVIMFTWDYEKGATLFVDGAMQDK